MKYSLKLIFSRSNARPIKNKTGIEAKSSKILKIEVPDVFKNKKFSNAPKTRELYAITSEQASKKKICTMTSLLIIGKLKANTFVKRAFSTKRDIMHSEKKISKVKDFKTESSILFLID